jgi:hypothetical protein
MKQHFVTFVSPGTFFTEQTTKEINSWDTKKAIKMAKSVLERYNATPFGFYFSTRARKNNELDSKVVNKSCMYYIGSIGKIETLEEIESRHDPEDSILISNMKGNNWDRVFTTTKGWKATLPIGKGDKVVF